MDIHRRAIARVREAARRHQTDAVRETAQHERGEDEELQRELRQAGRALREHDEAARERPSP